MRLLPPAPAAFFGTFAAFLPPVADGVLAILKLFTLLISYESSVSLDDSAINCESDEMILFYSTHFRKN